MNAHFRNTVSLFALGTMLACANRANDCNYTLSCGGEDTSESGGGGSGGRSNADGNDAGGDATGGITSACNPACSGDKPVCDEAAKRCVECLSESQCSGAKSVCKTDESADSGAGAGTNVCVECTKGEHCTGTATLCDPSANVCVECQTNDDCLEPSASLCLAGTCASCTANADCTHIAGRTVCGTTRSSASEADAGASGDAGTGPGTNTCVQCTGTDYSACGQSNGKNLVCDSLSNTCSTKTQASAGLCQTCVSDAQCAAGEMCVEEMFNGSSVGHFCFFKQGDTTNGAPADCTLTGQPYVKILKDATSIDGQVADICSLRVSTCPALNEFSSNDCTASGAANDQLCGVAPGVDSKCAPFGSSQYLCTVTCLSDYDCRSGVSCDLGLNPPVCSFQ